MISTERELWIYEVMNKIRCFVLKALQLFEEDKLRGSVHLYAGEEAIAATVCSLLRDEDYITSTHRGHGHCIAKGARLDKAMAELMGKATGYCKGRSGSMHIADFTKGNLGANAVVGGGIPSQSVQLWLLNTGVLIRLLFLSSVMAHLTEEFSMSH